MSPEAPASYPTICPAAPHARLSNDELYVEGHHRLRLKRSITKHSDNPEPLDGYLKDCLRFKYLAGCLNGSKLLAVRLFSYILPGPRCESSKIR
jgi:hypothetical protein